MKKIIIILVVLMLISCRSKKEYIHTTSNDTIRINSIVKIVPKQLNSLVIDNVCDSIGIANPFNYTFISNNVKGTVKSEHNKIKIDVNIDSIVNSFKEEYISSFKSKNKLLIEEVKRPFNLYSILLNVILAAWIFRKPIFRLIKPI